MNRSCAYCGSTNTESQGDYIMCDSCGRISKIHTGLELSKAELSLLSDALDTEEAAEFETVNNLYSRGHPAQARSREARLSKVKALANKIMYDLHIRGDTTETEQKQEGENDEK